MATDRPAKTDVNLRQAGPDIKQILANLRKSPKAKQKKVSPKVRRTAELYKSSHNIGNRTAADRVGSYKESEVAVVYPEGFWDVAQFEQEDTDAGFASDSEVGKEGGGGKDTKDPKDSKDSKEVKDTAEMGRRAASASPAKPAKSDPSLKELKVILDKKQAAAKDAKNTKKESPAKKKAEEKKKAVKEKGKDKEKKNQTEKTQAEEKAKGPKESPKKNKKDEVKTLSPKKEVGKSPSPAKGKQTPKSPANKEKKAKETKPKKKKENKKKDGDKKEEEEVASSVVDEGDESDRSGEKKKKKKKKKKKEEVDGKKSKKGKDKDKDKDGTEDEEKQPEKKEKKIKKEKKVSTKVVKKSEKGKKVKPAKEEDKKTEKKEKNGKEEKKNKGKDKEKEKEKDKERDKDKDKAKDKEKDEKAGKVKKSTKDKAEDKKGKKTKPKEKASVGAKAKDKKDKTAKGKDKKGAANKEGGKKTPIKKEIKRERSVSPASSTSSEETLSNLPSAFSLLGKRKTSRSDVKPRAPRIRRTACLNANAINSLLYEIDDPSPKRAKMDSDDSTEVSQDEAKTKSPAKQKKATSSPKKQDSVAKEKAEDKEKKTSTKKEKGKKQKGSKKPNKKATGNRVKKKSESKKKKKDESSDDSSSDESDDEEEEEMRRKRKAEEDIPLWPPPKRMASLNAQAILAASKEVYRRVKVEKPSKPEAEERKGEKPKPVEPEKVAPPKPSKPAEEPKKQLPKENKDDDKKKAEVVPMRVSTTASKTVTPEVQIVMEQRSNLPIQTQSPDVQIIEVRSPPQTAPPMTQRVPPYFSGNNSRSPSSSIQPQPGPLHPQPYPLPTSNMGHYPQQPTARSHYSYPGQPMQGSAYANPSSHNPPHMQQQRYDPMPPPSNSHYQFSSQGGPQYQRPYSGPAAAPMESPRPSHHLGAASATHSKAFGSDGPAVYHGLPPHQGYPQHQQQQQQQLRLQSSPTSPFQPTQPGGLGTIKPLESSANNSLASSPFHAPSTASSSSSSSSQLIPQAYGQQDNQEHGFAHRSSPMGNTCTYPYPHSNGVVQQPPHIEQYQGMPPFSAMNAMSSYQMMACHRPYGSAFSMPAFPPHLGYLQGGEEMMPSGGQDMCCVQSPFSYHVHQQQVKVLVHNPGGAFHTHHHHHHHHHPLDKDGMGRDMKLGPGPSMPSIHPTGHPAGHPTGHPPGRESGDYYTEGYGPPRLKAKSHSSASDGHPSHPSLRGRQHPRGIGPPPPPDREQQQQPSHSSHSSSRRSRTSAGSKRHSDPEPDRTTVTADPRVDNDQPTLLDLDAYKAERIKMPKSEKHSPNSSNSSNRFSKSDYASEKSTKSRSDKSSVKSERMNSRLDKTISSSLPSAESANSSRTPHIIYDSITIDRPLSVKSDRSPSVKNDKLSVRSSSVKSDKSNSRPPSVKSEKNNGSRPFTTKLDKNNGSKITEKSVTKNGKSDENSNDLTNGAKKDKFPPKVTNKSPKPANGKVINKTLAKVTTGKTEKLPITGDPKTVTKNDPKKDKTEKGSVVKPDGNKLMEDQAQKEKSMRLEVRISKLDQQGPEVKEKTSPRHKDKTEKASPKQKPAETPKKETVPKKKPIPCKWHWKGDPKTKRVFNPALEGQLVERSCYPAIQHADGDIIKVRDTVLVCSGPKKTDIPYVAKIAALWERENSPGEMMMSVVWYYRPEHTEMESEKIPLHIPCEIFASKHKDETPVACIEDKCHVLTLSEFCRFKAMIQRKSEGLPVSSEVVPLLPNSETPRRNRFPPLNANPETLFLCRRVYDFKLKRVLKNPAPS